jgi:hypothetical protein
MPTRDAITMLKEDHAKIRAQLEELASIGDRGVKRRRDVLRAVKVLLETHTILEEELFYPTFQAAAYPRDDQKMYYEAVEEHHAAKLVLADVESADPSTPNFAGKAKVLKELVLHHAKEEEHDMFPEARKYISRQELMSLAERMTERRRDLEKQARAAQ